MPYVLNVVYLIVLTILSPWLLFRGLTTGKYPSGLWRKLTGRAVRRTGSAPCAWFHGVSVGEVHLLRQVVAAFRKRHLDWECVISTTTETGHAEAKRCFADLSVFWWPLDFTWAVGRALRRVRPDLIVLAEGELWPNFLAAAKRRGVPVAVVNARMSPRSCRRYRRFGILTRRLFGRLDLCLAQTDEYAANFRALGVPAAKVHVTGSVKYDGACADSDNPRTRELRRLLAVEPDDLVWIAGSTQAPEEQLVVDIFRRAQERHPKLRLFVVPRAKDRFDEVAELLRRCGLPFVRRSTLTEPLRDRRAVVLVDSIGELGPLWGLADVAFVGGSLDGQRGGQNMIEPAAYGAAVVFGPHVWNFKQDVARLLEAGAAVQVANAAGLEQAVDELLGSAAARQRLGGLGRRLVARQQGAVERTLKLLGPVLCGSVNRPSLLRRRVG